MAFAAWAPRALMRPASDATQAGKADGGAAAARRGRGQAGLRWSPEQIMGWLLLAYPDDPTMRISHETIALRR